MQRTPDQPAGAPIPPSLLAIAESLVSRWEHELPVGVPRMPPMIMLTTEVRARMRDDIARALSDAISSTARP
jgi:hypothetical protein